MLSLLAVSILPSVLGQNTITAAPAVPTGLQEDIIGYSQTTTYETNSPLPLTEYYYAYSSVPYQVNPYPVGRGPQSGYNICNSTTEGYDSQCQTLEFNSIDDFCIWGAPGTSPNQTTADIEAAVVKYCTQPGHGGRLLPPGTFSGLQFMRTPAYIQITGLIDQTKVNLMADDQGGELDPHGADYMGNPLGGLVYSKTLPSGDNTTYQQTQSWNQFFDGPRFCIKLCDPNWTQTDNNYCQNIYDIIGCEYNMPAAYENDVFMSCEGDLQDEVGTYTSNGQTYTWHQPQSLAATATLPWTPRIPASSNCVTYQSSQLFASQSSTTSSPSGSKGSSGAAGSAKTSTYTGSATRSTGAAMASSTKKSGASKTSSVGVLSLMVVALGMVLVC